MPKWGWVLVGDFVKEKETGREGDKVICSPFPFRRTFSRLGDCVVIVSVVVDVDVVCR